MKEQAKNDFESTSKSVTKPGQKAGQTKQTNQKKKVKKLSERSRYFDFYDDVKAGCHKVIDW